MTLANDERWTELVSAAVANLLADGHYPCNLECRALVDPMLKFLRASAIASTASLRTLAHCAKALQLAHEQLIIVDQIADAQDRAPQAPSVLEELRALAFRCSQPHALESGDELCPDLQCVRRECAVCEGEDRLQVRESFILALFRAHCAVPIGEPALVILRELVEFADTSDNTPAASTAVINVLLEHVRDTVVYPDPTTQGWLLAQLKRRTNGDHLASAAYATALAATDDAISHMQPLFEEVLLHARDQLTENPLSRLRHYRYTDVIANFGFIGYDAEVEQPDHVVC